MEETSYGGSAVPPLDIDEDGQTERRPIVTRFTDDQGAFDQAIAKAVLINTAEKMLTALHDIITEAADLDGGNSFLKSDILLQS